MIIDIAYWFSFLALLYTYLGYYLVIFILTAFKRNSKKNTGISSQPLPHIGLVVPAYNEEKIIEEKIVNCLDLDYPKDRLTILIITDGSEDESPGLVKQMISTADHPIFHLHQSKRNGKAHAMNRSVSWFNSSKTPPEFLVFTDANSMLVKECISELIADFQDTSVGLVSGNKVVRSVDDLQASTEGSYWRYESSLKRMEDKLNTVIGVVGEIFAIRLDLYDEIPVETVTEDLYISLKLAQRGYKTSFAIDAKGIEYSDGRLSTEFERRSRIAAGGFQVIYTTPELLNPLVHPLLSWQFVSHRVCRWVLSPIAFMIWVIVNLYILYFPVETWHSTAANITCLFLIAAMSGSFFSLRHPLFQLPAYFVMIQIAMINGFLRYTTGRQKVTWNKVRT